VVITEIGGTTGDIEGLPFLEAIRQFALEVGQENTLFIHVTLVPYIKAAGELKSKPTQQSVAKLREIGIQPHVLICRTEHSIDRELRLKLSMFCDVANTIYEVPLMLQREKLDELVVRHLKLDLPPADMSAWRTFVDRIITPKHRVKIGVVGKYMENRDAYKSIYESLTHAGAAADSGIDLITVDAEEIEEHGAAQFLKGLDGILVPGGFGVRGVEGKILAARYARKEQIPYLGLCLGLQIAVVDFARDVLGLSKAHSTEFNSETPDPVISMLDEQKQVVKMGGTMRLGASVCHLIPGTKIQQAYGTDRATERHRHRYEFNNLYREKMEKHGLIIAGVTPDQKLVELIELADHPWFAACQFHPEFQSKPNKPHPLFSGFVKAAVARQHKR
jgi:CTP synthase